MFYLGTAVILLLLTVYFGTEGWHVLHQPIREFCFWLVVITCETGLVLLSRNSPVRSILGDNTEKATPAQLITFFGLAVPLVSAYILSWKFMKELLPYNPTRSLRESNFFAFKTPLSAKAKQGDVNAILERLSYKSHVRYFIAMFRGKLQERQDKLRDIFNKATPEELNFFIRTSNIPMLFQYGNLFETLLGKGEDGGIKTLGNLNPLPKAVLMHGLMKIGTLPFQRTQREWVRTMFLQTTGDELTVLKMHLDGSSDFHNLYKLLYTDFANDEELRNQILAHFQSESAKILKLNAEKHYPQTVKVLSDVDDTLWCSAGKWPAGIDRSLPSHQVYPGVLSLYEEIDHRGFLNHDEATGNSTDIEPEMVRVTVQIPYERGGGTASLRISSKESIEQVQLKFLEQFKIAPAAQRLSITASKFSSQGTNSRGHNLVFLSARPHAFKDFSESSSYARFKKLFEEGRMHTHPTLLAGSLRSGANAMVGDISRRARAMVLQGIQLLSAMFLTLDDKYFKLPVGHKARAFAEKWASDDVQLAMVNAEGGINANWNSVGRFKAETFQRFNALYPECVFLFIGDDGQGDVLASEMMSPSLRGSAKNPVALIHRVAADVSHVLSSFPPIMSEDEKQRKWKEMGIYFFDTYVGAGTVLLDLGLVSAQVVHRVGVSAREELVDMMLMNPAFERWPAAIETLNKDIAKANESIKRACNGNPKAPQIDLAVSPF